MRTCIQDSSSSGIQASGVASRLRTNPTPHVSVHNTATAGNMKIPEDAAVSANAELRQVAARSVPAHHETSRTAEVIMTHAAYPRPLNNG